MAPLEQPEPPQPEPLQVAAFYGFTALKQLEELRNQLQELAAAAGVRGTILLASEGVNGTISGSPAGVAQVLNRLRGIEGLEQLQAKFSQSPSQAFHRLKVRVKPEIVTMGCADVKPAERVGTYVAPAQWDELIRDPHTLVVDTRNDYEVAIGTFRGALDPGTRSFSELPAWVQAQSAPGMALAPANGRKPKVAMFCTGGIRCEKSTAYLRSQGFEEVYHLQGGILKYLETVPPEQSLWQGECFVFDERVSVGHGLREGDLDLCRSCRHPIGDMEKASDKYEEGISCPHCHEGLTEARKRGFAERQRQVALARERQQPHIGARMPERNPARTPTP